MTGHGHGPERSNGGARGLATWLDLLMFFCLLVSGLILAEIAFNAYRAQHARYDLTDDGRAVLNVAAGTDTE